MTEIPCERPTLSNDPSFFLRTTTPFCAHGHLVVRAKRSGCLPNLSIDFHTSRPHLRSIVHKQKPAIIRHSAFVYRLTGKTSCRTTACFLYILNSSEFRTANTLLMVMSTARDVFGSFALMTTTETVASRTVVTSRYPARSKWWLMLSIADRCAFLEQAYCKPQSFMSTLTETSRSAVSKLSERPVYQLL